MAEIKIFGTLVNDTNEAIAKASQIAAALQDGTAAMQSEVNADLYAKYAAVGKAYRVKGTKATIAEVTALTDKVEGDVWNVAAKFNLGGKDYPAGTNVVWTGSEWDPLGGTVDLEEVEDKIPTSAIYIPHADTGSLSYSNSKGHGLFFVEIPVANTHDNGLMANWDKSKLDGIEEGAQVNVIESVKVNGTALSVTGKEVNIDLSSYAKSADTIHVADVTATATGMNLKLRKAEGASPICNVTFNAATTSAAGLMSAADKARLDASASATDLATANAAIAALTARVAELESLLTLQ